MLFLVSRFGMMMHVDSRQKTRGVAQYPPDIIIILFGRHSSFLEGGVLRFLCCLRMVSQETSLAVAVAKLLFFFISCFYVNYL
jgi:hypothetical protein